MRAIWLAAFLATSATAETIAGLDDPAFRAPFERALQGDDPTALLELHAAAEGGNTAALLALPAVNDWLRAALPFADRKRVARVNGIPLAEAFAAADPAAALWAMGDPGSDMDVLLARAFALYDAGEQDKATSLFMTWLNQTGGYRPLPSGFFDHPVPPWAMAYVLRGRLIDNGVTLPADGDALIVERLKADDPAAWIALAAFAGLHNPDAAPPDTARLAAIFAAAGIAQDQAAQRMAAAVPALTALNRSDRSMDPVTAAAAVAIYRTEPEFQPIVALCQATCPATALQCTTAYVAAFGHPFGRATQSQPLTALISPADFFATPRGRLMLLRFGQLGDDPASSPALVAVREIDACLADAVLAALP